MSEASNFEADSIRKIIVGGATLNCPVNLAVCFLLLLGSSFLFGCRETLFPPNLEFCHEQRKKNKCASILNMKTLGD